MEDNQTKEINEAIVAVDCTLSHLTKAQEYLHSASNWGIFDLLGGGFFATMIKRGKMKDANKVLSDAKDSIKNLKNELNDVNELIKVDLKLGDFLSFADYFFDGVIADWMVQSKIKEAQKQVDQAIQKLNQIKACLIAIN